MSVHHRLCASSADPHHKGPCYDKDGHRLPPEQQRHAPGCGLGPSHPGLACFPRVETTALEVEIPTGPQPTKPGPYHAVVRGPGGLDVSLSGDGDLFGRMLAAVGDAIGAFLDVD